MGSIKKGPKAPEPQVVYVPQYIYESQSSASGSSGQGETAPSVEEQREKNLMSRGRSRLGTILTGFRGILAPSETQGQRKTLLGE